MNNSEAYDRWANSYDSVANLTRDVEGAVMREMLSVISFESVLELGCGTGKNTVWLAAGNRKVTGADFSHGMLSQAGNKLPANIRLVEADITRPWNFLYEKVDLVTESLVLEHLPDLDFIFSEAARWLNPGGYFYVGELHPFKQYTGSKARFQDNDDTHVLECFVHHFSDYMTAAFAAGFECIRVIERADTQSEIPRIAAFLFRLK